MNRNTKRLFPFMLVLSLLLTTNSFAALHDPNFTATKNRRFYTPASCIVEVAQKRIYFKDMSWNYASWGTGHYWEGEIRGISGSTTVSQAYTNATAVSGNLPNLYKEYDSDDTSIGCKEMSDIVASETYYATLTVAMAPTFTNGIDLCFESEYGDWMVFDGLPNYYQVFSTYLNTVSNRIIYW